MRLSLARSRRRVRVLFGRGAHQRDLRVVAVQQARRELRRHRVQRPEVHHVERADRADVRDARRRRTRPSRCGPADEHAADQLVGDLGRRQVEHRRQQARRGELFQRLPARAGGVEDEAVVARFERARHGLHARRRDAEHRQADGGPAVPSAQAACLPAPCRPSRGPRWPAPGARCGSGPTRRPPGRASKMSRAADIGAARRPKRAWTPASWAGRRAAPASRARQRGRAASRRRR